MHKIQEAMRVLIINTSERIGGAAIAANRLMEALKGKGIKAKMLVRDKQTDQVTVVPTEKIMETYLAVCLGTCNYLESKPFQKAQSFCC